jgi:cobalt/nickel transport protein
MKKSLVTGILIALLVVIFGVSFVIGGNHTDPEERFAGTDATATEQISESNPDYEPWFEPFFQPESGEVESGLFALQAALGGVVLGFVIGAYWGKRRGEQSSRPGPEPEADAEPVRPGSSDAAESVPDRDPTA